MPVDRVDPVVRDPGSSAGSVETPFAADAPAIPEVTGAACSLHEGLVTLRGHLTRRYSAADAPTKPRIAAVIGKIDQAIRTIPTDAAAAATLADAIDRDCDAIFGPATAAPVDGVERVTAGKGSTFSRTEADLEGRVSKMEARVAEEERKEAEEAKKPGFWRTLCEIIEFIARWFLPIVNLIAACVRVAKILYVGFTKGWDKIDWKDELIRLAGDVVGIFFPPVGAITNTVMNVVDPLQMFEKDGRKNGQSQILGGINPEVLNPMDREHFLKIGKLIDVSPNDKDNWFRGTFNDAVDGVGDLFKGGLGIGTRTPEKGGVDYRPIEPVPAAEPVPVR